MTRAGLGRGSESVHTPVLGMDDSCWCSMSAGTCRGRELSHPAQASRAVPHGLFQKATAISFPPLFSKAQN